MKGIQLILATTIASAACGGDASDTGSRNSGAATQSGVASAVPTVPAGPLTTPEWYSVDGDAGTAHLTIIAGATPDNNYWNMNGAIRGELAITVPEGYTVTIDFVNRDPNMAHSLGVSSELSNFAVPPTPNPVFEGAITSNPQSMIDSTMPGETESITFVAGTAGNYSLVCYIAGHSTVGMWLFFNVSGDGTAGVQGL